MLDEFWQQQPAERRQIICDYHSLSANGLRHQIAPEALNNFSLENDSEPRRLLNACLIVDLLSSTNDLGSSGDSTHSKALFLSLLDKVLPTFGLKRIAQFLGHQNPDTGVELRKQRYAAYFNDRINEVKQAIDMIGRSPSSAFDYLNNFTFGRPRLSPNRLYDVESIRFKQGSKMLQVRSAGDQIYRSISVSDLHHCVSELGTNNLLLQLLCNRPECELLIPAGSRGDSGAASHFTNSSVDKDEEEKPNCFKECLLLSSVPSPSGKQRIRKSFPNHELPMSEIHSLLDESVKTVVMKAIKANINETAMTAQSEMIGVFFDEGQRKHCVFIDGKDGSGGSISDPVEGYGKGLVRSDYSLRQLGISEFCELYTLSRKKNEMSDRNEWQEEDEVTESDEPSLLWRPLNIWSFPTESNVLNYYHLAFFVELCDVTFKAP